MTYTDQLNQRVERHRAFLERRSAGDLLVYINHGRTPALTLFLCGRLHAEGADRVGEPAWVRGVVDEYVAELRRSYAGFYGVEDDSVPCAAVYWGIGGITAAMVGRDPVHDERTTWLEPNLAWDAIDRLSFDPENKWVRFAVELNRALWALREDDYQVLPFLHRSPLDAANGIRGTELFVDMYQAPERVLALADWCADWSLAMEALLHAEAPGVAGAGAGVWGAWLPDGAVFVNGDPVGLINRDQAMQFDRPSNEKLFTRTGGGLFHNHTIGLHQVDCVSGYDGILLQWFVNDPHQPTLEEALLDDPAMRDRLLAASLECPIAGRVNADRLDQVLDIVRHGRFILSVSCPSGTDPAPHIRSVRKVSRID